MAVTRPLSTIGSVPPDYEREAIRRNSPEARGPARPSTYPRKAEDMLRPTRAISERPQGAVSRIALAAIRYKGALASARDELVAAAEALEPALRTLDDEQLADLPKKTRAAVRAGRHLELLKALEFTTVISPKHNDPNEWEQWSDGAAIETAIERFKRRLDKEKTLKTDPLAFLCVKSMSTASPPGRGVMDLDARSRAERASIARVTAPKPRRGGGSRRLSRRRESRRNSRCVQPETSRARFRAQGRIPKSGPCSARSMCSITRVDIDDEKAASSYSKTETARELPSSSSSPYQPSVVAATEVCVVNREEAREDIRARKHRYREGCRCSRSHVSKVRE